MGWHKVDVEGRIMWESPGGERVRDRNDIYKRESNTNQETSDSSIGGAILFFFLVVIGIVIGIAIGSNCG